MNLRKFIFLASLARVMVAPVAAEGPSVAASSNADAAWTTLRGQLPPLTGTLNKADATQASRWHAAADRLRDFASVRAGDATAGEANAFEALYLMRAEEAGDATVQARLDDLVARVRSNVAIPEHDRYLVASNANRLAWVHGSRLDHAGRLAAFERSARDIIAAFPAEPQPYWSLFALARDAVDERAGVALAKELLAMPEAPAAAKTAAANLVARRALIGRTVDALYRTADGKQHRLSEWKGKPIALYSWSARSPGSGRLAERLAKAAGADTIVIGMALDRDTGLARTFASEHALPGILIYDPEGAGGLLAQELHVSGPGEIMLIDRDGVLREDRGELDLVTKLAVVEAPKGGKS